MVAWSGLAGSDAYDVLGMGIGCIDNASNTWRLRDGATSSHPRSPPPPILAQPTPYPDLAKARSAAGSVAAAPITTKKGLPGLGGQKKKTVPSTRRPPHDAALPFCGPPSFCQVYFSESWV